MAPVPARPRLRGKQTREDDDEGPTRIDPQVGGSDQPDAEQTPFLTEIDPRLMEAPGAVSQVAPELPPVPNPGVASDVPAAPRSTPRAAPRSTPGVVASLNATRMWGSGSSQPVRREQRVDSLARGTTQPPAPVAPRAPAPESPASSAPATTLTLQPGQHIQHYELIRELGRGGMGQVYLARDTKLGRRVAIKFLLGTTRQFTERFLVEARATARCSHENIVIIHEVNEFEGAPYMVLEFLEGQPLSALLAQGPLPVARAVEIMVPVIRALVRAHEYNIVHRDLKPDNIFVTDSGTVKVLDFGIAKLFTGEEQPQQRPLTVADVGAMEGSNLTREGALVGTLPYMSPEQFGVAPVDHRTDIWAVGIMLFEMIAGRHPLHPLTPQVIISNAIMVDQPMPSLLEAAPHASESLAWIVSNCLAKQKERRFKSSAALLEAMEPLLPGRVGRKLKLDECPYPGLNAFQEADADRFFGRSRDVARAATRIREYPLVGVAGPSGVGKSSFVRAGLVPALKSSGEVWETHIIRPGRHPMASLTSLLQPLTTSTSGDLSTKMAEHEALAARLWSEPGYLGTLLRSRARQMDCRVLLFVDQFEELYTLVSDQAERRAFTACLAGVADDAATPLRVVVSMRSDFLDRVAEDQRFTEELTRGLIFLQPPDRAGLREALTQPVEMVGYRFENPQMVEHMLNSLESTPGALPLLQFAAARLWDARDRSHQMLTQERYEAMGGIAGTLASHADEVLAGLSAPAQQLVRAIFQRLVTPERTRAIVDVSELLELTEDRAEMERVVNHLVMARLLVVQKRGEAEGTAVEIVHESLIESWPTLARWLDEGHEDAAYLAQLREAARQWTQKGKPAGLLWRGEAMEEARHWSRRYSGDLPPREAEYLQAVFALANRSARIKRTVVIATISFLALLVAAAAVALVWIRNAEQESRREAERARRAEMTVSAQLQEIKDKEKARAEAAQAARTAQGQVAMSKEELKQANAQLTVALSKAEEQKERAELEAKRAQKAEKEALRSADKVNKLAASEAKARERAERLLAKERARVEQLEKERNKITTELRK